MFAKETVLDDYLINRIIAGDEQAYELLFRRYYRRLCGFAFKILGDKNDSEEVVQEVFFNIWKNRQNLTPKENLKPYLFKSVQNLCFNFIRHRKVVDQSYRIIELIYENNPPANENAFDKLLAEELEVKIDHAIDKLPTECRKIFLLSRDEGLKYSEIAEKINISIKTVETQISRALKKLKVELKDYLTVLIISILSQL